MKWTSMLVLSFLSFSTFAMPISNCPQALPSDHPNFCASFKSVAICHCTESGLPAKRCQNMSLIYNLMIARFGSIQRACEYQRDTTTQVCLDDWSCYRTGGKNSSGNLCSSTGNVCAS